MNTPSCLVGLPTISGIFLHTYNGTPPLKHVVFLSAPAWSHLRPALKTALRMVEKFPDLFISLFVYHSELSNANKYLSNQQSVCSRRIKIVTGSSVKTAPTLATSNPMEMLDFLELSFKLWITSELQLGSVIQVDGRPVDAPSVIMEDVFNGGMSLSCKNEHNLPIVGWWLATSASLMTKAADVLVQLNKINFISTTFDWVLNISSQLLQNASDRLINIPGLPPHREWELNPQYFPFMPLFMAYLVPRVTRIINEVDAIACCTTLEMEPVCAASLSSSFKYPIESFFIGPAVDLASPNHENDSESLVTQFLNRAYAEKGAHSVIYIAFGTVFFPSSGSIPHLMAILDEIPKAGLKFIFSLSSASAKLEKAWMDAHIAAGNAIFPHWTNQTAATHYFLSHGGWSSCTEALVRGVPMIFWPFTGDQPVNSMQIAEIHDCGFELLQIRTGPAKSKAYQNGTEIEIAGTDDAVRGEMKQILDMSKGARGEQQRMNTRRLGRTIRDSLSPGGSGDLALEDFGAVLGLAH
ncbi:Glycosyltransferase family 1 protein [Rhizoctonia solani]|uniref:Glycosyltransferase family 1 protein n=1 Tax=Rhizoctonia solani TaxID=456999 RepID=A0A8H7M1L8_9AGAM|nr:Glycosyltransferase family 1 protein [Rhizoctonia solani]